MKYNNIELKIIFVILIIIYQILNSYQVVNNGNILTMGDGNVTIGAGKEFAIKAAN